MQASRHPQEVCVQVLTARESHVTKETPEFLLGMFSTIGKAQGARARHKEYAKRRREHYEYDIEVWVIDGKIQGDW